MKNVLIRFLLIAAFFGVPGSVLAGSQTGIITAIHVRTSDDLIYVVLDGPISNRPACATINYWMIKNENSTTGKQQLAQLLAARASGQKITLTGLNTCTRWPDGEDIDEVVF